MRYFLRLAYNGAGYHGWQNQPNDISVQQTIESALAVVFRKPVAITGAGRTDAGVNAREMYAHVDIDEEISDKKRLLLSLNRLCGKDIAIYDIIPVDSSAHARFDASSRTYKYFVSFKKDPFIYPFAWFSPSRLNIDEMNEAAKVLIATNDFTSFAKLHSDAKTNICKVTRAEWSTDNPDYTVFTISADRFLRNMVRAVVGTLIDVGRGKLTIDGFKNIIEAKDRCSAGTSMPPGPLFLWKVSYPYIP